MSDLYNSVLREHAAVFSLLEDFGPRLDALAQRAARTLEDGGTLYFAGNGGSACDAQHLAAELVGRYVSTRRPLRAMALGADSAATTCISNDFGYEQVVARQLEGLGRRGDLVFLISTSGNSANLLLAADTARRQGIHSVGLLGKGGGQLASRVDQAFIVPSQTTARIQEAHIFFGHYLCEQIEVYLGLA